MSKLAQAVREEQRVDSTQAESESEKLVLKEKVEAEIRMQLDDFARELSQAAKLRNKH
ncbi:MAG: hypothetical protein RKH07_00120 [Gammaproteobacteria bacterium]